MTIPTDQIAPKRKWLDILSMSLSGLCVLHCLALPVIAGFLPSLGTLLGWDGFHQVLVLTALPASIWAIASKKGWRRFDVILPLGLGFAFLTLAAFIPALKSYETPMSILGALMIAFAHWRNINFRPKPVAPETCTKDFCTCR